MMRTLFPVIAAASMLWSPLAQGEDTCLQFFNQKTRDQSFFWGYGESTIQPVAVDVARVDLAKQIRVQVNSSSRVVEDRLSVDFQSNAESVVSENLTEARVVKSCNDGGKFQTVVKINKGQLLKSIRSKVRLHSEKLLQHLDTIKNAASRKDKIISAVAAQADITENGPLLKSNFFLCLNLGSCNALDLKAIDQLSAEVQQLIGNKRLKFLPEDDLALDLKADLKDIIQKEGYSVSEQKSEANLKASCRKTVFARSEQLDQQFVEISCNLQGVLEGVVIFTHEISATGFGNTEKDAVQLARSQLEIVR
ncbi:hypothetical protein [Pseudobacteriovorax antillogorgiicola]|uniref:LPP20 lipoprotein n=1 Tax=Pseudobacteriovorax antillogorgiicola TaxID=1513793 RepID=A0A1Y6BHY4_9BACT|nr:hypothetical protein [Pseudobacteriovorax antillogorgiicola]TCS55437.1 hypothetical protein EDD56_105158 [Pseudobacteriovorax antillogorgiicola]SMF12448.1 hypothetical protein SAMN06296036_105166 [Pseudobacteriovorax antillogorgiicola]